jgi:hypothetical protein
VAPVRSALGYWVGAWQKHQEDNIALHDTAASSGTTRSGRARERGQGITWKPIGDG